MFIEFTTQDHKTVLLNKNQIVTIESDNQPVAMMVQGGGQTLRIFATEGRVYSLDPKVISYDNLRKQLEPQELVSDHGQDKSNPIR